MVRPRDKNAPGNNGESYWPLPRESRPDVDQGPGGALHLRPCLGFSWCWLAELSEIAEKREVFCVVLGRRPATVLREKKQVWKWRNKSIFDKKSSICKQFKVMLQFQGGFDVVGMISDWKLQQILGNVGKTNTKLFCLSGLLYLRVGPQSDFRATSPMTLPKSYIIFFGVLTYPCCSRVC